MGGGSSPSVPKAKQPTPPPAPVPPVMAEDPDVQSGVEAVRRRLRGKSGRAGTLLTSETAAGGKTRLGE